MLAEDGQKMSKRKKNYPDPKDIIDKYGADALRLYLTNRCVLFKCVFLLLFLFICILVFITDNFTYMIILGKYTIFSSVQYCTENITYNFSISCTDTFVYSTDRLTISIHFSPCTRGENLRFQESGVLSLVKEVFLPWLNAYRFFVQQVER